MTSRKWQPKLDWQVVSQSERGKERQENPARVDIALPLLNWHAIVFSLYHYSERSTDCAKTHCSEGTRFSPYLFDFLFPFRHN